VACLAGVGASEVLCRSVSFRAGIARLGNGSELLALVNGAGIYQSDLDADPEGDLDALIVAVNLRGSSLHEQISRDAIERELNLLSAQFGDEKAFAKALQGSALSVDSLRSEVAQHLQSRAWLEKQIAPSLAVRDEECRQFYEAKRKEFVQPPRFRARHLFLAAHDETPVDQVESKRQAIKVFAARIAKGESVAQLAAEASEDEATKKQGGDLGFFSAARVPPELFEQVSTLRFGQITAPFQSHLGFHIVELTDTRPARALSFEEARGEIAFALANEKRAIAAATIRQQLASADFIRTPQP
jgi:parvulin-like peptidyl-prolyl isomerase